MGAGHEHHRLDSAGVMAPGHSRVIVIGRVGRREVWRRSERERCGRRPLALGGTIPHRLDTRIECSNISRSRSRASGRSDRQPARAAGGGWRYSRPTSPARRCVLALYRNEQRHNEGERRRGPIPPSWAHAAGLATGCRAPESTSVSHARRPRMVGWAKPLAPLIPRSRAAVDEACLAEDWIPEGWRRWARTPVRPAASICSVRPETCVLASERQSTLRLKASRA